MNKYTHLHLHTKYSEKDGIGDPNKLMKKCKEFGMDSVAITDHGHLYGMVDFIQSAEKNGIKPIIGCEIYCTSSYEQECDERLHLILLAKNNIGLKNLYKIVSKSGFNKYRGKQKQFPRIKHEDLKEYGEGIICLSACAFGRIPQYIINGEHDKALEFIKYYNGIFDEFYLELQTHEFHDQLALNMKLMEFSKELNIPLVITCDVHYIDEKEKKYHDYLSKMNFRTPNDAQLHFKSYEEIKIYCDKYNIPEEAISNTVKIAESIDVNARPIDSKGLLPDFRKLPEGYTDDDYVRELCNDSFIKMAKERGWTDLKERVNRLNFELDIIISKGFSSYFLILWDWVKWMRKMGILTGPGRGSAAASFVSYLLNITKINPIKYGYYFQRFMNPERIEYPDYQIDSRVA